MVAILAIVVLTLVGTLLTGTGSASAASPAAACRAKGYDNYSTHYRKCVRVYYSYTNNQVVSDHRSQPHHFDSRFQLNLSYRCWTNSSLKYTFYSSTLGRNWKSGTIRDGRTSGEVTIASFYSDRAQTLRMHLVSDDCEYTVKVYR